MKHRPGLRGARQNGRRRGLRGALGRVCDPRRAAAHGLPPLRDAGGAGLGLVVVKREYARDEVLIQELAARV